MIAISGEWKPCETASRVTVAPAAASRAPAASTASVAPEITVCLGWLRFATTTSRDSPTWCSTTARSACTADIAPRSTSGTSAMIRPRRATNRTASRGVSPPLAASAANSPRL